MITPTKGQKKEVNMRKKINGTFVVGKESEKFFSFLSGYDLNPEVWGGVGVSCI